MTAVEALASANALEEDCSNGTNDTINDSNGNSNTNMWMAMSNGQSEPEIIRKWKEEQRLKLEEKDRDEEKACLQLKEQAKQELTTWYKHNKEQMSKMQQAHRSASECTERELRSFPATSGTEWERVARLCDFNKRCGTKDVSRLKSMLLQLKQGEKNAAFAVANCNKGEEQQ